MKSIRTLKSIRKNSFKNFSKANDSDQKEEKYMIKCNIDKYFPRDTYNVSELCKKAGITRAAYYKILSGENIPRIDTALKITEYFNKKSLIPYLWELDPEEKKEFEYYGVEIFMKGKIKIEINTMIEDEVDEILKEGLYDQAISLMDDEIREDLHSEIAPCSDKEFLTAYMKRHFKKYKEIFHVV